MSLSFWIMQNFQLTHEERLALMKLNTTLERLRLELQFLKLVSHSQLNCTQMILENMCFSRECFVVVSASREFRRRPALQLCQKMASRATIVIPVR